MYTAIVTAKEHRRNGRYTDQKFAVSLDSWGAVEGFCQTLRLKTTATENQLRLRPFSYDVEVWNNATGKAAMAMTTAPYVGYTPSAPQTEA